MPSLPGSASPFGLIVDPSMVTLSSRNGSAGCGVAHWIRTVSGPVAVTDSIADVHDTFSPFLRA